MTDEPAHRPWVVHVATTGDDAHDALLAAVRRLTGAPAPRLVHACGECGSDAHGRPVVVDAGPVWCSLSRPRDVGPAAYAVCLDGPVGIDIERAGAVIFEGFDDVALHADEHCADPSARTRSWTRKEALLKAHGTGLTTDPRSVLIASDGTVLAGPTGRVVDVDLGEAWVCAVV